jgi:hypothetical protein
MARDPEEAPFLDVPSNTVIELMPRAFTCDLKHYPMSKQPAGASTEPTAQPPLSPTPKAV